MKRNWPKIKAEYLTTTISTRQLAKKYKIPYATLARRSAKEKWSTLKADNLIDIDEQATEKMIQRRKESEIEKKVKTNELHTALFDKGLQIADMLLNQYVSALQSGKKKSGATAANLGLIMKALVNAQKGQRISLCLDSGTVEEPEINVIKGLDMEKI